MGAMDRTVGIGFIGCGMVSELHHPAVVANAETARLVGVFDIDGERAVARARDWGVRAYDSQDALLADEAIAAVFVLSPLEAHKEQVLAALRHGKHVLVEKPAGLSVEDILEMADAAEQAGRVVMPGHNYLYQPDVWRARRLIRGDNLGRICATWVHYAIHHPEEVAAHYHGVLREVLPHHLSLILYLLGRPASVWAVQQSLHYENLRQDDQASVVLQMEDGATAHLFASFAVDDPTSDPWTFLVKVLGTRGGVSYSWRDAIFQRPLGSLGFAIAPYEESYTYEVNHFVSRCILRGEAPLSTILDAARIQRLVELAEESIASGASAPVPDDARLWGTEWGGARRP